MCSKLTVTKAPGVIDQPTAMSNIEFGQHDKERSRLECDNEETDSDSSSNITDSTDSSESTDSEDDEYTEKGYTRKQAAWGTSDYINDAEFSRVNLPSCLDLPKTVPKPRGKAQAPKRKAV